MALSGSPEKTFENALKAYRSGDLNGALRLFLEAAESGHGAAMYNLGIMHGNGLGTERDEKSFLSWMEKAAEAGHAGACNILINTFMSDKYSDRNYERALEWADRLVALDPSNARYASRRDSIHSLVSDCRNMSEAQLLAKGNELASSGDPDNAFRYYMAAADRGNTDAMIAVSRAYSSGQGVEMDLSLSRIWADRASITQADDMGSSDSSLPSELLRRGMEAYNSARYSTAVDLFRKAAEGGERLGYHNLSVCYANGQGVRKDPVQSFLFMNKAAEMGLPIACMTLSHKYRLGDGTDVDMEQALAWARKACELDPENEEYSAALKKLEDPQQEEDPLQLVISGVNSINEGEPQKAFKLFKKAAELGSPVAMFNLAVCYGNGTGTRIDVRLSNRWMNEAAEHGFEKAVQNRFDHAMFGSSKPDLAKGLYWAEKLYRIDPTNPTYEENLEYLRSRAATDGTVDASSLVNEGMDLLDKGEEDEAFRSFLRAAEAGHPIGMHNVSACYARGTGTDVDRKKAFEWMKKSAEAGYDEACKILSVKYYQGDGTPRDPAKALEWICKAVELSPGDKTFRSDLKELTGLIANEDPSLIPDPDLLYSQAELLDQDGTREESFSAYLQAAMAGCAPAMFELRSRYSLGDGTQPDRARSRIWLEAAAEAGDPDALRSLYSVYRSSEGKDDSKALDIIRRLLKMLPDNARIQSEYAKFKSELEMKGITVENADDVMNQAIDLLQNGDMEKGLELLNKASEMGSAMAMYNLAMCYANGEGYDKDDVKAFDLLLKAAERGYREAYSDLSDFYLMGRGTEKDPEKALLRCEKALRADPENDALISKLNALRSRRSM